MTLDQFIDRTKSVSGNTEIVIRAGGPDDLVIDVLGYVNYKIVIFALPEAERQALLKVD